jgi:antirestriction protein ArdC
MVPVPFAPRGRNRAARKQRGTAMTKERFDIHQHITDKIVNAIERRAGDFRLPWHYAFRNRRFLRRAAGRLTTHRQRLELR